MSITFINECNYLAEAISLMSIYYHRTNFTELQQSLKKSSGYHIEADQILNTMQKIYEKILLQLELPEALSIYFDHFDEESRTEGLAVCMLYEGLCHREIPIKELASYMKESFHQNRSSFLSAIFDSGIETKELSDAQFMKELEAIRCGDDIKWNIWRVYQNYDEHLDNLMNTIVTIIPVMQKVYRSFEHEFEPFHAYWQEAVMDESFFTKLKIATNIDLQDDCELHVCPSWMGCNSVRLYSTLQNLNDAHLLLGLLFREKEFVNDTNLTHDEICRSLKLLSDSSKYEIAKLIKKQSLYGSQLAERLSLSTATISHHVNGLSGAGLINITKDSNRIYYQLNKEQVGFLLDQIRRDLFDDEP